MAVEIKLPWCSRRTSRRSRTRKASPVGTTYPRTPSSSRSSSTGDVRVLPSLAYAVNVGDPDRESLLGHLRVRPSGDTVLGDRHCGVRFEKPDGKLYTFPADMPVNAEIREHTWASLLQGGKNLWMAFGRVKPLRPGG